MEIGDKMDAAQVWEAIRDVVETGNEDDEVDLKCKWYSLDDKPGKAEFLKDVCAMANDLAGPEDRRYLVCGVLDSKQCPSRDDATNYVKGVQPGNADGINQQITQLVNEYIEPSIAVRYIEIPHLEAQTTIGLIEIRGASRWQDERPYVLAKGIGELKESQIFVRRAGSLSEPARWSDIQRLIRDSQQQRIESLEQELEEAQSSMEEAHQKIVVQLQREYEDLEEELLGEMEGLQADKAELHREAEGWKELTRNLCRRLGQSLPDNNHRNWLRSLMKRYGREKELDLWIAR